jgi:hypothetical protein
MLRLLIALLTLSSCVSPGKLDPLQVKWQFCEISPQKHLACVEPDELVKIKYYLKDLKNKCEAPLR